VPCRTSKVRGRSSAALRGPQKEDTMILRPLVMIHCKEYLLKIGDREIPFETRQEWSKEDEHRPRERCIGADGFEAEHETAFLEHFGIPYPWKRETGKVDGKQVQFFPGGPPDASLTLLYEHTLRHCNYYFRDLAQEEQERKYPGRPFTKVPLEWVTNLIDLTKQEQQMIFRSFDRQRAGGEILDPAPPSEPTPEELGNIDELPPPELETLIGKLEAHQQWDKLKQTARKKASWFAHLRQANQSQRCTHIKPDGSTCGSPAVKERTLCYWHEQAQLHREIAGSAVLDGSDLRQLTSAAEELPASNASAQVASAAFELPVLEDRLGIQLGIMRVCGHLADKSIDPYTARVMLYGLRLAQRSLGKESSLDGEQQ
jgi:rubredoxin